MGRLNLAVQTTPGPTSAGTVEIYADSSDKMLKQINEFGVVIVLGYNSSVTVAASGAINTTETIVSAPFSIPVNSLKVGSTIRITLFGTCTSTAANASNFRVRYGSLGTVADAIIATMATSVAATSGTTVPFDAVIEITFRTIGAAGSVVGSLCLINNGVTGISAVNAQVIALTQTTAPNTTTATNIEVTYQSAASTTTCTFQRVIIEFVQP